MNVPAGWVTGTQTQSTRNFLVEIGAGGRVPTNMSYFAMHRFKFNNENVGLIMNPTE
jgi:hypothetical protein